MASDKCYHYGEGDHNKREKESDVSYLIVRPEKVGIWGLFGFLVRGTGGFGFLERSETSSSTVLGGGVEAADDDYRWVIVVSIVVRKIMAILGKPLEWTGYAFEFLLNLFSVNGGLPGLLYNLLFAKIVIPRRDSETFVSAIGHLDGRLDLYSGGDLSFRSGTTCTSGSKESASHVLMDLCIMASKIAYENANFIRNVVVNHWKACISFCFILILHYDSQPMHFVDFYNGWNDFEKDRTTQVFILCDKPKDANLILISFRGTEPFDADDWMTDFDYSWYEIPKLGKVHMGFLEALGLGNRNEVATFQNHLRVKHSKPSQGSSSVSYSKGQKTDIVSRGNEEMTAYYSVRNKLKNLLEEYKEAKFVVTGHSLGGALAILFPTVLLLHEETQILKRLSSVYTFGQPRVGNWQLGNYMEAHLNDPVPKYFRVVYCNDLVPRLPYDDATFLYKHFGMCLYYNSFYIEQNVHEEPNRNFFGIRYLLPEYLNAVWELIRSLVMGSIYGPGYKEGWLSVLLRVVGLGLPGISAHSPTNYVNCVRLGTYRTSSF
ncbi:Fungal lipase-like domain [Dillenia turbinata]|uniref:Fungal lipase-like domain n=1 Tax=Dillenia turbinata TaxID=194707 RepID=A0AAN8UIL1_9MAGN